jgi:hypothetical protein
MKLVWALTVLGMVAAGGAWAQQQTALGAQVMQDQIARDEQMIGRLQQQVQDLMQQVRELQRQNVALAKTIQNGTDKNAALADQVQGLQNTEVLNLHAGQKQLAGQIKDIKGRMWGEGQRDCPDLGVKHQQVRVVTRPDGMKTVRFLCFDGKALHLETEINDPRD